MIKHSVEKIGGTSMSRYDDVLKNIWQRPQVPHGEKNGKKKEERGEDKRIKKERKEKIKRRNM